MNFFTMNFKRIGLFLSGFLFFACETQSLFLEESFRGDLTPEEIYMEAVERIGNNLSVYDANIINAGLPDSTENIPFEVIYTNFPDGDNEHHIIGINSAKPLRGVYLLPVQYDSIRTPFYYDLEFSSFHNSRTSALLESDPNTYIFDLYVYDLNDLCFEIAVYDFEGNTSQVTMACLTDYDFEEEGDSDTITGELLVGTWEAIYAEPYIETIECGNGGTIYLDSAIIEEFNNSEYKGRSIIFNENGTFVYEFKERYLDYGILLGSDDCSLDFIDVLIVHKTISGYWSIEDEYLSLTQSKKEDHVTGITYYQEEELFTNLLLNYEYDDTLGDYKITIPFDIYDRDFDNNIFSYDFIKL